MNTGEEGMNQFIDKPRVMWKEDETRVMLESWKNNLYIKRFIKKHHSKNPLYFAISKDLKKCGHDRSVKEIDFKTKNILRKYRRSKGPEDMQFYNELKEIVKLEEKMATEDNILAEAFPTTKKPVVDGSYVEGIGSENVQVIRLSAPDHQDASDSSPLSYTVISRAEPEVENVIEVTETKHLPQSSSNTSQEISENILLSFYQEFERSNRQLEKNDAAMLELFKEQNDIFRTQTTLLMKFLAK